MDFSPKVSLFPTETDLLEVQELKVWETIFREDIEGESQTLGPMKRGSLVVTCPRPHTTGTGSPYADSELPQTLVQHTLQHVAYLISARV
jgi:hypothetical protein